jgi:hypothetical protein
MALECRSTNAADAGKNFSEAPTAAAGTRFPPSSEFQTGLSRSNPMIRTVACALAVFVLVGNVSADKKGGNGQNNQMVRGTVKSVEADKAVLIVNQKVKGETVVRELDISDNTVFVFADGEVVGKEGLQQPELKPGVSVNIKCDKDVKVLRVRVMGGKK